MWDYITIWLYADYFLELQSNWKNNPSKFYATNILKSVKHLLRKILRTLK